MVNYRNWAFGLLAAFATTAAPASAQWGVGLYGVAEYDTNETTLLLAGLSASPGGLGLKPMVGLQTYYLTYDAGTTSRNVWAFRPSAGLAKGFASGSAYATVGYAFVSDDDGPAPGLVQDTEDGVTTSLGLDYTGTGGPLGAQALASYSFAGESLWLRGRVTTRVSQRANGGQIRVGAESAFMSSDTYDAIQPGGLVEWHNGRGLVLGLGAGLKLIDGTDDDPVYFKLEFSLPVR